MLGMSAMTSQVWETEREEKNDHTSKICTFYIYQTLLSKATYSAFRLYIFCQYMSSLGIEPTAFALLMQCSTTEPQEHVNDFNDKMINDQMSRSTLGAREQGEVRTQNNI